MKTIEDMKKILSTYSNGTLFIGMNLFKDVSINNLTKEEKEIFTKKGLMRNTEKFFEIYLEKIYNQCTEKDKKIYKLITELIKTNYFSTIILQDAMHPNINELINISNYNIDIIDLKGFSDTLICKNCKTLYTAESMINDNKVLQECEICGKNLRPNMLLNKELYDAKIDMKIQNILNNTNSLFCIGLDYNESIVVDYISLFNEASKDKEKLLVSVLDNDIDINEICFHDFVVNGSIEESLKRLISLL